MEEKDLIVKNSNKSGLDAVFEILNICVATSDEIHTLLENFKSLNNKINNISSRLDIIEKKLNTPIQNVISSNQSQSTEKPFAVAAASPHKNIKKPELVMLHGHFLDRAKKPIQNVSIKIFSLDNSLIASAKSEPDGYWQTNVPPNQYKISIEAQGFDPITREIDANAGQQEIEIV